MQLGLIGLGRMGANMARRLRRSGIEVHGFDRDSTLVGELAADIDLHPASDLASLVAGLAAPRRLWMMLPAGAVTAAAIDELAELLAPGDILVDGANSFYKDAMQCAERLSRSGIHFVDAGVSGGVWGLESGYGLMVGGERQAVTALTPILEALAPDPEHGWLHCGPSGSGHFVKMIHNGIEYGMMQAYAEGFNLLRGRAEFGLDLAAIAESWRHGSVVRSWLLDLTAQVLAEDPAMAEIAPYVADSGEGRWTVQEAIEQGVPAPAITLALMMRFSSQGQGDYGSRLLAMMRNAFGGHALQHVPQPPLPDGD